MNTSFDLEQAITKWRQQMTADGINAPEVLNELENHLREEIAELMLSGKEMEEAFSQAARQLGEGQSLQREFTKIDRQPWWAIACGPTALKVLAVWIIISGFNGLFNTRQVISISQRLQYAPQVVKLLLIFFTLSFPLLRIVAGIGLYRHWRAARLYAFACCVNEVVWVVYWRIRGIYFGLPFRSASDGFQYHFLGVPVPYSISLTLSFTGLAIMAWGCVLLTRASVRKQFQLVNT